jgi:uncharacterized iron-regulated protein
LSHSIVGCPRVVSALAGTVCLLAAACATATRVPAHAPVPESRVYESQAQRYVSFATFADAAARADVVLFGEQHDNPATHRAELALLAAVGARRTNVVLSLEMFDRDVQSVLDAYLAGQIPESAFVAASRAWPRYNTDYRALVELARAHGWPVVAANPARRLATMVSRAGLSALDTISARDRSFVARSLSCPRDLYYERFAESMKGHSAGGGPPTAGDAAAAAAMTTRFYEAQCVKDETMGESIATALTKAGTGAIVLHFNGAFHTDMGLGTAARARQRLPGARTVLVTAVPVDDVARADAAPFADRADYVVLTPKPPRQKAP